MSRFAVTLYVNGVWDGKPHRLVSDTATAKEAAEQVCGQELDAIGAKHRLRATVRGISENAGPGQTPEPFYQQ